MMKKILCGVMLILFSFSCKKDDTNEIPYVPVDFVVNISSAPALNTPGNWVFVSGGSKGIVIYRRSLEEFIAMERHCPYQPANGNYVSADTSNTNFLRDPECGSKFNIINGGTVENGPATHPLKRYNATFDGVNTVHIYN